MNRNACFGALALSALGAFAALPEAEETDELLPAFVIFSGMRVP